MCFFAFARLRVGSKGRSGVSSTITRPMEQSSSTISQPLELGSGLMSGASSSQQDSIDHGIVILGKDVYIEYGNIEKNNQI